MLPRKYPRAERCSHQCFFMILVSSSVVSKVSKGLGFSFNQLGNGRERGGLPLLAAGLGKGWLWWLCQLGQVCKTWLISVALLEDLWSTSGFRCVPSSAQTFCNLPFKTSFSTASVSFTTLGFHIALQALGAVMLFFLQSFTPVWFSKQHLYCLPPAPPRYTFHAFLKLHFIFCATGSHRDSQLFYLRLCHSGIGEKKRGKTWTEMWMLGGRRCRGTGSIHGAPHGETSSLCGTKWFYTHNRGTLWIERFKGRACQLQKTNL